MKRCPYCAEEIQDEAVLCRYCHMSIEDNIKTGPTVVTQPKAMKKMSTSLKVSIILLSVFFVMIMSCLVLGFIQTSSSPNGSKLTPEEQVQKALKSNNIIIVNHYLRVLPKTTPGYSELKAFLPKLRIEQALNSNSSFVIEKNLELIPKDSPYYKAIERHLAEVKAKEEKVRREQKLAEQKRKRAERIALEQKMKKELGSRGYNIWKKHPSWKTSDIKLITQGKVHIGMNQEQCRYSWGRPAHINKSTYSWGTSSQWCYGDYCDSALYFDNGILSSIQN